MAPNFCLNPNRHQIVMGGHVNGYQRIMAALHGDPPDGEPIMLHNFMPAARKAGYSMREYRSDPRAIADTPGFILNAGCALPATTPPENIHALIRTARSFQG